MWLGDAASGPRWAVDLSALDDAELAALAPGAVPAELRTAAAGLAHEDGALLAYARGILEWHDRLRHCPACGAPTRAIDGGHVRVCEGEGCGTQHYPRTDPAVIVLVTHGDACLLGNQASWAPELYSTLAGFVEPGETLEDAVMREVAEEAGVAVRSIRYHSSQPWPFPSSLMVGFTAEAAGRTIAPRDTELRDVRWFTREEIRAGTAAGTLRLSNPVSISRRLIEEWLRPPPPFEDRGPGTIVDPGPGGVVRE